MYPQSTTTPHHYSRYATITGEKSFDDSVEILYTLSLEKQLFIIWTHTTKHTMMLFQSLSHSTPE